MKVKIFHFILDHRVGGPHIYVRNLGKVLRLDAEFTLVTAGRGPLSNKALINLRHYLRLFYPIEVVLNSLLILLWFRRKRSRRGVIFDVHGAANLAPIFAARILRIPLVWHFHETIDEYFKLAQVGRAVCAGGQCRYVVVAARAAKVFGLTNAELIPGAVDIEFWAASSVKANSGGAPYPFKILMVGNLNPLKGADILLAALERVSFPCEITVVGSELQTYLTYAENLRKHAIRLESKGHSIRFTGWQPTGVVRDWMAQADVFVLPSRSEACPLALLEAMAAGCACVAADVGDVREIIGSSGAGIVVQPDSPEAFKDALEDVFALGSSGRQEMGRIAREVVREHYSLQEQAAKHLNIYKELVMQGRK